jgi:hypothetical protein
MSPEKDQDHFCEVTSDAIADVDQLAGGGAL